MAFDQLDLTSQQLDFFRCEISVADSAVVYDSGVGSDRRLVSEFFGFQAVVCLFCVHEETGIEATEFIPELAGGQEEAAREYVDFFDGIAIPTTVVGFIKQAAFAEDFTHAQRTE